jgi:hypothetical protein
MILINRQKTCLVIKIYAYYTGIKTHILTLLINLTLMLIYTTNKL